MTRQELNERMQDIVDRVVMHYKDDFKTDMEILDNAEEESHRHYVWIPRENGTFLFPVDNSVGKEEFFEAVMQNFRHELMIFEIHRSGEEWKIKISCEENIKKEFDKKKKFELCITDEYGRIVWKDIGIFDNQIEADKCVKRITERYADNRKKYSYVTPA